eukprot:Skav226716  [mRNA]  locus=scaffold3811:197819:199406:- [translate_table: standard]
MRTSTTAGVSLIETSMDLSALVVPAEMSLPERLKKDLELSAKDEWTLRNCCGSAVVREDSSIADKASMWTDGHEKRIQAFLELSLDKEVAGRPTVLHHQESKILERFQAASEKILKVHDQKFQCQVCNKFFKGQEYVFKHLHRFHLNILDDIREEFFQEMSQTAFLADPDHPPAHALSC